MTKIRGNGTKEVACTVTIVKIYRGPYPHLRNTSSSFRTVIIWEQSIELWSTDLEALEVVPVAAIFINMAGVLIVIMNGSGALFAPRGKIWLGRSHCFIAAFGITVVFVLPRRRPDVPVLPACAIETLIFSMIGLFGARTCAILTSYPLMVGLMGFIVMPVSWGLLTLAPRHTSPTNVSLFMLLWMILGPFWVWMGTGSAQAQP